MRQTDLFVFSPRSQLIQHPAPSMKPAQQHQFRNALRRTSPRRLGSRGSSEWGGGRGVKLLSLFSQTTSPPCSREFLPPLLTLRALCCPSHHTHLPHHQLKGATDIKLKVRYSELQGKFPSQNVNKFASCTRRRLEMNERVETESKCGQINVAWRRVVWVRPVAELWV